MAKDFDDVKDNVALDGNCLPGYSHCFGSDGGSAYPANMRVTPGKGGNQEVHEFEDKKKDKIKKKYIYSQCQFCEKYIYAADIT